MKALVYLGPNTVALRDVPEPVPEAGEVLVRVEAVGICGSDMHAYHGHDSRRPAAADSRSRGRRPHRHRPARRRARHHQSAGGRSGLSLCHRRPLASVANAADHFDAATPRRICRAGAHS